MDKDIQKLLSESNQLVEKWLPVIEKDGKQNLTEEKTKVLARLMENQQKNLQESQVNFGGDSVALGHDGNTTAGISGIDKMMMGLVRRTTPKFIGFDICGVQPMTAPTQMMFGLKSTYGHMGGKEALYNEADMEWSAKDKLPPVVDGSGNMTPATSTYTRSPTDVFSSLLTLSHGMSTRTAEEATMNEMAMRIERGSVTARSRALKASWTVELEQDLKAVHGLDAQVELENIVTNEIVADINQEILHTVYKIGTLGCTTGTTTAGVFNCDTDADGRNRIEKIKGLLLQIDYEANAIYKETRAGRGNFIICSPNVASALSNAGVLDIAGKQSALGELNIGDGSSTYLGVLNGKYKVFVDPYSINDANTQFVVVGYKGTGLGDAGLFYCPYIPLTKYGAQDPVTFQPRLGFKTRYAVAANGFSNSDGTFSTAIVNDKNSYYRKFLVTNIM